MLEQNWREGEREGVPYGYTCPSPGHYPYQWYWDSCFTAIARSSYDAARAREELRTLLRAQRPDGFIGHTIFWGQRIDAERARRYNVVDRDDHTTWTIQPPLIAWAWEIVARRSDDDPSFAGEALEPLARHYDWLAEHRDLDGSSLLAIVQPDESGLDASPKFDQVWGRRCCGQPGFLLLVRRNRRLGFDARRIATQHPAEHVREVLTNVLYIQGLRALARLGGGERFADRADRAREALVRDCWDGEAGLFWDLAGTEARPLRVNTWSSLAPLCLDSLPEEVAHRLIREHLLDDAEYVTPVPIPSVAATEPSFNPGADVGRFLVLKLRRYWRGPSWVNTAWMLIPAMRHLGYTDQADRMLGPLLDAMQREGLREYYDAGSGEGLGAVDFGWSGLALELL